MNGLARWSVVAALVASAVGKDAPKPKLPADLQTIVDLADAAPPEFTSDALLRVGAAGKIDKNLRIELIDRAFHVAAGAQFQTPLRLEPDAPDSLEAMTAAASKLGLDRLSLQIRAVEMMLHLDAKAARTLFLEVTQPDPPPCRKAVVADAGPQYAVLTGLASVAFGPENGEAIAVRLKGALQSLIPPTCDAASHPLITPFWTSESGKRLYRRGLHLRYREDGQTPRSEEQRNTPEWFRQLADYMSDLAALTPLDEKDPATYYHQKAIIYEMLVELTPHGPERDRAIQAYVDFIAHSNLERERPAEWFFHAQSLAERVRNTSSADAPKVLDAFHDSGDPVLVLYAALDRQKLSR